MYRVGVGWSWERKTRLSARELANEGTVFFFLAGTTSGGQLRSICVGLGFSTPHKGDDRIT